MTTNTFEILGLSEVLLKAVADMGFTSPTTVQSEAIPAVLSGSDLIVMSKTGSGKTGAFGLPIIEKIDGAGAGPKALILTPTRELAVQVDYDLKLMAKHKKIPMTAVYGQHNIQTEIAALEKGAAIVTGTPGRVFDHISQGTLKTSDIEFLVLDEADRMLDMGFIDQVVRIIKKLPKKRQTMLFSATMPPEIKSICAAYMKEPHQVQIESETKTVDTIAQSYFRVKHDEKRTQLERILRVADPESCMIFCNTRIAVDKVKSFLLDKGYTVKALHGANSQSSRLKAINSFKKNEYQILVATDVAARGIHVEDLALVINYDVPFEKDSYVHRIGRTGRAGNGGRAISLVTADDIMTLYEIEEHIGALIEEEELPTKEVYEAAVALQKERAPRFKPMAPEPERTERAPQKPGQRQSGANKPKPKAGQSAGHKPNGPAHKPSGPDQKPNGTEQKRHSTQRQQNQTIRSGAKSHEAPREHRPRRDYQADRPKVTEAVKQPPMVEAKPTPQPPAKQSFFQKIVALFRK